MTSDTTQLEHTLSHRTLTLGLILLTLIPFGFVVLLYSSMPPNTDPELNVQVQIGSRPWQSNDGSQVRLLPSMIVQNPTTESWNNLNFAINDQFYYYHSDPLTPGEELTVPLKFFHTKGNQFFPPESQPLKSVTVYAQIPSGARAIKKLKQADLASSPEEGDSSL